MNQALRFENLYGEELDRAIARLPLAWVPLGILERHGEHLPWGLDGIKAHGVCLHLAQRLGGVVLPACHLAGVHEPWLPDPAAARKLMAKVRDFYLSEATLRMLLEDTGRGLAQVGFRMIVFYTGHYPQLQIHVVNDVAQRLTAAGVAQVVGFDELTFFGDGDHAGKWESSIYLALGGEFRRAALRDEHRDRTGYWYSNSPPHQASLEFGQQALARISAHFEQLVTEHRKLLLRG
ncbi:MAG: hypothetical protein PCFJNLEI_00622 [Verrucomicrobiae bacterium]|nr:hypothetical protein [Verrucomicrobiae bacterium]